MGENADQNNSKYGLFSCSDTWEYGILSFRRPLSWTKYGKIRALAYISISGRLFPSLVLTRLLSGLNLVFQCFLISFYLNVYFILHKSFIGKIAVPRLFYFHIISLLAQPDTSKEVWFNFIFIFNRVSISPLFHSFLEFCSIAVPFDF